MKQKQRGKKIPMYASTSVYVDTNKIKVVGMPELYNANAMNHNADIVSIMHTHTHTYIGEKFQIIEE